MASVYNCTLAINCLITNNNNSEINFQCMSWDALGVRRSAEGANCQGIKKRSVDCGGPQQQDTLEQQLD